VSTFNYRFKRNSGPISVEDYRRAARRQVPSMVWAFIDEGAEDLVTLGDNRRAFDEWRFIPRVLTNRSTTDLSVSVPGADLDMPIMLSPTGITGLAHWHGERAGARAAHRMGTRAIISSGSSWTVEEIAARGNTGHFFQLYPQGGEATRDDDLLARAAASGFSALVVTVDVPILGNREGERRLGLDFPPIVSPSTVLDTLRHPRWWAAALQHKRVSARMYATGPGARNAVRSVDRFKTSLNPILGWSDFDRARDAWNGPVYLKGVLSPQDAELALEHGADGVIVSNHGGRQLDGAVSSLEALPAIVDQVGGRATVMIDGGIRRGSDIVKALCLGADVVCIGRPYVYGLAAAGQAGVEDVISILAGETRRVMTLLGVGSVAELDRSFLTRARSSGN
jgi:L-lactate dehydrogenase (cytochrome)/(S)-mandelate dehydrogenase